MKYTIESLQKKNPGYMEMMDMISQGDVDIANHYVELIENSRTKTAPKAGDLLQYTDKYGEYHARAHIEYVDKLGWSGNVCEGGSCAHVFESGGEVKCSGSGGPWCDIPPEDMEYVGEDEKSFWTWGCHGAGAHRGIYFNAKVNVWRYVHPEFKGKFTTKDYDRFFINRLDRRRDSEYMYKIDSTFDSGNSHYGTACKTEDELKAWIHTFRGEYDGENCWGGKVIWTWKQITHTVSPTEFDALDLPEDTMLMNARIMRCKRRYDNENHKVHLYYVWYWHEEGDFCENSMRQNKIREEKYELDWHTPQYMLARKELGIE